MNNTRPGLDRIETASRDEIAALQLQRMQWSLRHAYDNVPHYREKYDAAGVHPDDLKQLSDLAKFPFTTKGDMRDTYPYGMFATPMREVVRVHASSGTTGKPTVVGYTKNDIATWAHVMARSMHAAGCTPDDIILNSYGYGLFTGGLGAHYGAECLGATVIPMSGGQTEKQIQLIQDFKPTVIMATPSYMLTIADEMDALGIAPKASSLRVGMFGAEPWTNQMRREIEQRLGIDAIDLYGLSEVIGPGVACECVESKDGPHIWEDHFYPEIIHPETGELLPDGEPGELVLTSLTKEANPIIRYRTRDLTRLLPGTVAQHAAHGEDRRPQRRHADHPRRQCLPLADRGTGAEAAAAGAELPARSDATAHPGRAVALGRTASRLRRHRRQRAADHRQGTAPPHQVLYRRLGGGAHRRVRPARALDRQGEAGDRQALERQPALSP
jgi:phenylacetate-coenzyme A ligase PaaK-like adenylate-forming protein